MCYSVSCGYALGGYSYSYNEACQYGHCRGHNYSDGSSDGCSRNLVRILDTVGATLRVMRKDTSGEGRTFRGRGRVRVGFGFCSLRVSFRVRVRVRINGSVVG